MTVFFGLEKRRDDKNKIFLFPADFRKPSPMARHGSYFRLLQKSARSAGHLFQNSF